MIKVVIADDIQILRQGPKAILGQDSNIQVAGLTADGRGAWQLYGKVKPNVVLTDMRMPQYDGSYGIAEIKEEFLDIKVLVLTTFDDRETVDVAVCSGADGYILKGMEDDKVIQSAKTVYTGIRVFGGSVFEGIRRQMAPSGFRPDQVMDLTPRERDIMRLVAQGMDNREIVAELLLAEDTVRNNISRLLEKLKLKNHIQLAVFAVKDNLDWTAFLYTMNSDQSYGRNDP